MTSETDDETSQPPPDLDFATLAPKTWREWRDRLPEAHQDAKLLAMWRYADRTDFAGRKLADNNVFRFDLRKALNAELEEQEKQPWRHRQWSYLESKYWEERRSKLESARFRPESIDDLAKLGPMDYLIHGLIPAGQAFLLFGPRKAGKTFLAIDMGLCIATGRDWHDRAVKKGKVLHVIAEGNKAAIGNRVTAWLDANAKDPAERAALAEDIRAHWRLIGSPVYVDNEATLAEFLQTIGDGWSLVIIDPLLRAMSGDTNAQRDMSAFIAAFDAIRLATGGACLIVHHSGKDESKGPLGSIALEAAVDGAARFTKDGGRHTLQVTLMRDAPDKQPALVFELVSSPIDFEAGIELAALRLVTAKVGLLEAIKGTDNPTADSLASSMGVDRATVFRRLKVARASGLVDMDRIKLTPKGLETE